MWGVACSIQKLEFIERVMFNWMWWADQTKSLKYFMYLTLTLINTLNQCDFGFAVLYVLVVDYTSIRDCMLHVTDKYFSIPPTKLGKGKKSYITILHLDHSSSHQVYPLYSFFLFFLSYLSYIARDILE